MKLSTSRAIGGAATRVTLAQTHAVRRSRGLSVTFLILLLFLGLGLLLRSVPDKPEIVFALGVSLIFAVCIIRWPITGIFMTIVMVVLFDTFPSHDVHTFFSDLEIFRNLSYKGLPEGVVVSLFELVIALSMISALVNRFHERKKLVKGPLFWPMVAFGMVVLVGEFTGILSGGDFKISLWEIRPLVYLVILYVLTVNTVDKAATTGILLWLTLACIGVRCVEGIWRYTQIPDNIRASVATVLEHDDSLFLVVPFTLVLATVLWRKWLPKHLLAWLLVLLPLASYVIVINHRRAAYLCIILSVVCCLPLMWVALRSKEQRSRFIYVAVASAILGALYVGAFWNSSSSLAAPAQSLRSIVQPDDRDYTSNLYRDQENANLKYTISFSPIVGIGFGKPMQLNTPMVDLTESWALQLYMPHNNMLWLWMRMGIIGFIILWIVVGSAVLLVATSVRLGANKLRALIAEEYELVQALPHDMKSPPVHLSTPWLTVAHIQRSTRVNERKSEEERHSDRHAGEKTWRLLLAKRREMRECAEFLMLNVLTITVLASLVATAVVDQGLMSARLTPYTGVILGVLSVVWGIYNARFRALEVEESNELPDRETSPYSVRRTRRFVRA